MTRARLGITLGILVIGLPAVLVLLLWVTARSSLRRSMEPSASRDSHPPPA